MLIEPKWAEMSRELPNTALRRRSAAGERGFTLLEVLVALALLGVGMAVVYTAISGSSRLYRTTAAHSAAMLLARAKLDEALATQDFSLAKEIEPLDFAGVSFGYRLTVTPVQLLGLEKAKILNMPRQLQRVSIEVFWGEKENPNSYILTGYSTSGSAATVRASGGS